MRNWWTAEYLDDLPDEAVDAFFAYSEQMPLGVRSARCCRGAARWPARDRHADGQARRGVGHAPVLHLGGRRARRRSTSPGAGRAGTSFAPWATGGVYLNFIGDEGEERVRAAFGEPYDRLAAVKAQYDPENVFRGNQNIRPRSQLAA